MFVDEISSDITLLEPVANAAKMSQCWGFADLLWERGDIDSMFEDPGVIFENDRRLLVIGRINGEIRYFAGVKDADGASSVFEIGRFFSVDNALNLSLIHI